MSLASDRLSDITDITTLTTQFILPESHTLVPNNAGWWKTAVFGRQLVRLMTEQGLFGVNESGVNFLSRLLPTPISAVHAAARPNITQSAFSARPTRLRQLLGDPAVHPGVVWSLRPRPGVP